MNNQRNNGTNRQGLPGARQPGVWMRLVCVICTAVLLLATCVGCTSYVTADVFDALKKELTEEIQALQSSNNAAQGEIDSLKTSYDAARKELDALKGSYDAAQKELDALKGSYDAAQKELGTLKGNYDAAQKELAALKGSYGASQKEIDALKGSYAAAQKELDALKNSCDAAQTEIERLKEQIRELQEQVPPVKKIRIYIDQGHNPTSYHNAGATGNGLYEQDLTFTIGRFLAQLLKKDGRFEVCLSRPTVDTVLGTDNTSSLEARVKGAQEFGADYFISLHTNSFSSESAHGIEVYAAEQNSTSYAFGSQLLQGMVRATNLRNRGMKLNPDLYVLKNATMPAVLLEMGFISNREDAALLAQKPDLFARGIYEGVLAYFGFPALDISEY